MSFGERWGNEGGGRDLNYRVKERGKWQEMTIVYYLIGKLRGNSLVVHSRKATVYWL